MSLEYSFEDIKGRLFPVVCLWDGPHIEIQANFSGPFRYNDDAGVREELEESKPVKMVSLF